MVIPEKLRKYIPRQESISRSLSPVIFMHDKRLGQLYKCPRLIKYRRHYGHRRVIDYEFA